MGRPRYKVKLPLRYSPASLVQIAWCMVLVLACDSRASDYGTTGLIDIPTARFGDDGDFTAAASTDERHRQFSITYQATPWLEATFRYTGLEGYFFWDRNYEAKLKLWDEGALLPQAAVGIRDMVGTGHFGSEYLVASKRVSGVDVTLGLGWGRLADKGSFSNPLSTLDDRFTVRSADSGRGGKLSVGDFFSGPNTGVFGGLSYRSRRLPITAMLEYNPDLYRIDETQGIEPPDSPWSLGFTWHALENLDLRISIQHGRELGLGFSSGLNSKSEPQSVNSSNFISSYYLSQSDLPPQIDKRRWYDRLLYDAERRGLILVAAKLSPDGEVAQLLIGNAQYSIWSDAIAQYTALADLHLPPSVKAIYFIVEEAGHRTVTVRVSRPSALNSKNESARIAGIKVLPGRSLDSPNFKTGFYTGKIHTDIGLKTRFQLFDPDDPARYQWYAGVSSTYVLSNYLSLQSEIAIDLGNNFNESNRRDPNTNLEPVRSDIVKYLQDGETGLKKFVIQARNTVGSNIHYRVTAGILEEMFVGYAAEALYWPSKSRLAFGISAGHAQRRDYDGGLGLLDYRVFTGFASLYWATPFYNYDVAIHMGRYLAKDTGGTLEFRRTFRNGWQIGAWATFTDIPFDKFGEGSFDKGFYFQIPLEQVFQTGTKGNFATRLRPIQRDGGQRLEGYSGDIFFDLRSARFDVFRVDGRLLR